MSKAIFIATALLLAVFEAQAQQPHLRASVLSVGANGTGGGGIVLQSTLAQPVIGPALGSAYRVNAGFWYQAQPPIGAVAVLATPTLLTPEDGAVVYPSGGVMVAWQAVPGATTYILELATVEDFSSLVLAVGDFTAPTRTLQGLEANTVYFWRVQAISSSGISAFSAPFRFSTGTSVAVEAEAGVPSHFALHPNYPNPFNPTTTIAYDLAQAAEVRLVVYDLFGRAVKTLVEKRQAAGRYEVTFEADGLASGTYFYRIEAGAWSRTRQFIVLK